MTETKRRARSGGGAARRAERTAVVIDTARFIERNIPNLEIFHDEAIELIEDRAEQVLEEIGVAFLDNPPAIERWREAGADIDGDRVRIPRGLARQLIASAPPTFDQTARNPAKTVTIGGRGLVLAPVYGPPFVRDFDGGRRYATLDDFQNFVRLGQMSKWLHHSGGILCEPTDVPVAHRHMEMFRAHATLSDKPFMGGVNEATQARDSVAMAEILHGRDTVDAGPVLTSLININSPLKFDLVMTGAMEVYAAANQASIISPFIVGGAMAPATVAGTLVQVLAEVMAGVAYAQLVRKGAPCIFGAFVTSIDMNSGAPTFGTPEAAQVTLGAGQLARRLKLPYRSGGSFTGSKLADGQAGYETANSLNTALLAGVNFMLHAAGWLEGGLVSGFEKFVMDVDQLGALHKFAAGVTVDDDTLGLDAIREVGPYGHYLGTAHTEKHYKTAYWRSEVLDYKPFETWSDEGARRTDEIASARVQRLLRDYQAPDIDPGTLEALDAFIAKRKEELA